MPKVTEKAMTQYGEFVNVLKDKIKYFISSPIEQWKEIATKYVNGYAADELRRLVDLDVRRQYGAFFTDTDLASKVLDFFKPQFSQESYVYDPACGAGNLLISISEYLRKQEIVIDLQKQLLGTDLHDEFVLAARLRLMIDSLLNNNTHIGTVVNKAADFSILQGDGLRSNSFYKKATHIFVNPPFNQIISNEKLTWAQGKVSSAALFIDKIIQNSKPGTSIIAILPDVLRSGSRYEKWRNIVESQTEFDNLLHLGQFDRFADIDVYAINLIKRTKKSNLSKKLNSLDNDKNSQEPVIKDLFDICVGSVVDNRDEKKGQFRPYVVSKGLQGWSSQRFFKLNRRHQSEGVKGPFVVVKRTSRMTDANRAIATLINTREPVYIDNHLIILKPKSGLVRDCRFVLRILQDKRTNNWLNKQIRCRHLTVKVVGNIPIWTWK